MKALLCKTFGPASSLTVEDVPLPEPKPSEVRIQVKAAGVNFPDTLIIEGKYQFKPTLPFSPGGECVGLIDALGEGVTGWKKGDRVVALTMWGCFAEYAVAPAKNLIPAPSGLSDAQAGGYLLTYGTSHHALKQRGRLQPGETLLVLGAAGGVGLSAVELGKKMGAKVIAQASTEEKRALCTARGADEVIDVSSEPLKDAVKRLTGGKGVDVIYDPVGGDLGLEAVRCLAWKGRFLIVGFASGKIPSVPLNLALLKGAELVGVFWGDFTQREPQVFAENMKELHTWLGAGKLEPVVSQTFSLDDAAQAIEVLANRQARGKVVVTP